MSSVPSRSAKPSSIFGIEKRARRLIINPCEIYRPKTVTKFCNLNCHFELPLYSPLWQVFKVSCRRSLH